MKFKMLIVLAAVNQHYTCNNVIIGITLKNKKNKKIKKILYFTSFSIINSIYEIRLKTKSFKNVHPQWTIILWNVGIGTITIVCIEFNFKWSFRNILYVISIINIFQSKISFLKLGIQNVLLFPTSSREWLLFRCFKKYFIPNNFPRVEKTFLFLLCLAVRPSSLRCIIILL